MKQAVLIFALLLVTATLAHKNHHGGGHKGEGKEDTVKPVTAQTSTDSSPCKYQSPSGLHYDFSLFDYGLGLWVDSLAATVYIHPCSGSSWQGLCPDDTMVCFVENTGVGTTKAISYGSNKAVQWADSRDNSIEATYGNGEICNNGIARKTVVEYICKLNSNPPSRIVNITMMDSCSVQIIVESQFVCPVEKYCGNIADSSDCNSKEQSGLCVWSKENNKCIMNDMKNHMRFHSDLLGLVLIACSGVLLLCTCGLCICACKRRRALKRSQRGKAPARKVSRKSSGKSVKKVSVKEPEYTPFQVPFQLVPGGFAPNPYSEVQGYPMTTFVAPAGFETEQHV